MKLLIDTTQVRKAIVTLENGEKVTKEGSDLLVLIAQVLEENDLKLADLEEIQVKQGPGSYTGIRIGTAVANALNFSLGKEKVILPKYE
ncbi:MAG: hypothetical protein A3F33_01930 [Candidatus Woykebacteria bacterium RIFCSPHIGHO2_12_FULL_43_10]|uniref:Gcp-like domain-containing protein n=2 Tax=Candidatus Woykeibacteriota TaxID=1817899 RepID=A0A1G1WVV5_9BACT|nr:MAG: hypothetical protein A3J50_01460 [Candidatus Woykebacteria bacterium RIFCSPHIGHO2_02_FULL_43_16b]OGY30305.1 MAG: hypothetical protein A3F33_01930 [Candidatus Woykebacteria bacterium RIFCSPHIGHO2_12_FULL_43_10]OGY31833.1 MAG: hypothetical protein A3A61_02450 [Candidatus Woykebacteria bacterium RIFCSPLOWO2_01_FULL_43_14]